MKKVLIYLVMAIVLLLATACGNSNELKKGTENADDKSIEPITLKLAASQPVTHTLHEGVFIPFMEKVTELTDGQVEFDFYPSEQLGKAGDLYDLTSGGVTDLSFIVSTYTPSLMPITGSLLGIPGLYNNSYEGTKALHMLNKESPVLETDFLDNGVRPLVSSALLPNEFWTKGKEIILPSDIKGVKARVTGEALNKAVSALGGTPINLTASEFYEAFDRGVYDSLVLNATSMNDYGFSELAKYGTDGISFGGLATGLIINEDVYQKLPEDIKEILVQVGDEVTESYAKYLDDANDAVKKELKDLGITIRELTPEEDAQWKQFYSEIETTLMSEKTEVDYIEIVNKFKEEVGKYK
ncbi:TRAP transporter substrate-binding protein DctP [Sporosarcina sp. P13]|uniref:TRAP transporter substrate-binding protein DctP n=1 Tax=Sporosarcina sp. P13 TaxID=2048263 RepID=UPI001E43BCBF|nr:TRAP transporter substrate-binding protein DctP [Sporosarcina sp. P13]